MYILFLNIILVHHRGPLSKYKNFLSVLQLWLLTSWVAENSLFVVSLGESLGHHCETSQQGWLIGQFLTSKVQALPWMMGEITLIPFRVLSANAYLVTLWVAVCQEAWT